MLFLFQAEMAGEALMPNMAHFVEIWRAALQNGQADPETAFYTTVTLTHLVNDMYFFMEKSYVPCI